MNIPAEQADKLKRYFINADPFLWGVLEAKNKKERLKKLKELGFLEGYPERSNPVYSKINRDLLVELGIDGILEKIVVPQITHKFSKEILRQLRDNWEQGQTPELKYWKASKLYRNHLLAGHEQYEAEGGWRAQPKKSGFTDLAFIFVQIDTQHNFVERWTVFAGLWFEFIEPLLN